MREDRLGQGGQDRRGQRVAHPGDGDERGARHQAGEVVRVGRRVDRVPRRLDDQQRYPHPPELVAAFEPTLIGPGVRGGVARGAGVVDSVGHWGHATAVRDRRHPLVKRYGARPVVDDLSLAVPAGVICALLGPNGERKTSPWTCIQGLPTPDAGSLRVG